MAVFKKGDRVIVKEPVRKEKYGVIKCKGISVETGKVGNPSKPEFWTFWYVDLDDGTPDIFCEDIIEKV